MSEDIVLKVKQIIAERLQVAAEDVNGSDDFMLDLKADSLELTELIMAFEQAFGLEIPDADMVKLRTVQDAIDYLQANVR